MQAVESFGVAAFRSRQQAIYFEGILKNKQIKCVIMSTPSEIQVGCGLSVRFSVADMSKVMAVYKATKVSSLIGIYKVQRDGAKTSVSKMVKP